MIDLQALVFKPGKRSDRPFYLRWKSEGWNRNRLRGELEGLTDDQIVELRRLCYAQAKADADPDAEPTSKASREQINSSVKAGVWTIDARGRISTLGQLLDRAEVDTDRWYVDTWRANSYEAQRAGGGIVQLWQVKASLRERPAWLWSPVEPRDTFEPVTVDNPEITLVIPDSQNGYSWTDKYRRLEPLHDRRAWHIAIQAAEILQPDRIFLLGDMVDFAEGSKRWPITPDLRATTQPTIEELHWWLARLRAAAPGAACYYAAGNHEDRLDRALVGAVPELIPLRPAGEDAALVTWERLLSLDALGIEYLAPYGRVLALADDCEATHGSTVAQGGGATVARILRSAHVSQVVGHIHRREYAARTIYGPSGRRVIFAASPGSLCRIDGVVPAVKRRVDWQQGLAILRHGKRTSCELVPIDEGEAWIEGKHVIGRDLGADIAVDTGWDQLA